MEAPLNDSSHASPEEQQIYALLNASEDTPPELIENAKQFIFQTTNSIEGLKWCIDSFSTCQLPSTKIFIIDVFNFWLFNRVSSIPEELLGSIQEILFSNEASNCNKIFSARACFIQNYFPTIWPDFWNFLFSQAPEYQGEFLNLFNKLIGFPTPNNFTHLKELKHFLRENGISDKMLEFAFSLIQSMNPIGFSILSTLSRWTDISWIQNEALMTSLLKGFQNKETASYVFNILSVIISHSLPLENKMQLISTFVDPDKIVEICQGLNDYNVSLSAVKFCTLAWQYLAKDPSTSLSSLCLVFAQLDGEISLVLVPYLYSYAISHPTEISSIFNIVFSRLDSLFTNENLEFNEDIISFAKQWSTIISASFFQEKESIQEQIEVLERLCASNDPSENPSQAASLLVIFSTLCANDCLINISVYIDHYSSILSISPSEEQTPILRYLQYFFLALNGFSTSIKKQIPETFLIIQYYITLLLSDTLSSSSFQIFHSEFLRFIRSITIKGFPFSSEIFTGLIGTNLDKNFELAASLLSICINNSEDNSKDQFLVQLLTDFKEKNTISDISLALNFLK